MTEINFDKPIPDDGESPGIPEIVRFRTTQLLQHAKRVTIEVRGRDGKHSKANGFKLTPVKDADGWPLEEVDEVCEAIMKCINARFAEAQAVDESVESLDFRIVFDRRPDGHQRARPSIELSGYSPDGPDLPIGYGMSDEAVNAAYPELVDSLGSLLDKLMLRVDGLLEHMLKQSDQGSKIFDPLVQMSAMAHQNSVLGMEMQRNAMAYMYSVRRAEAEEAGKDRRQERWMAFLKQPATIAVQQFMTYVANRANKPTGHNDGDGNIDPRAHAARHRAASTPGDTQKQSPPSDEQTDEAKADESPLEDPIEHPVAMLAQMLGTLLLPTQWGKLAEILTRREMQLFIAMFSAETDDEVVAAYAAIEEGIKVPKLLQLAAVLDEQQQRGLQQLQALVQRHRENWE